MKRQDLERLIDQGDPPHALMLYGESHFLIERYIRLMSRSDASLLSLYYDEYRLESAKAHLSQGSLFGDTNLLLIKSEKKIPKKDLETLIALCKKNPDNLFIYAYFGTDFKKSATSAFSAKSGGVAIRLFPPFFNEAKAILLQEASRMGIAMDNDAAYHLLDIQNNDLSLAYNELSKFQVLDRPITAKEVDDLVFGLAEVKVDRLIDRLLNKEDFRDDLHHLLESGEDEIRIITALSTFVTQLYLFNIYIKVHGAANSADILGYRLPAHVEKSRTQLCIRFKPQTYEAMLRLLLDAELKMKSAGSVDKNAVTLSTLLHLQRIL